MTTTSTSATTIPFLSNTFYFRADKYFTIVTVFNELVLVVIELVELDLVELELVGCPMVI